MSSKKNKKPKLSADQKIFNKKLEMLNRFQSTKKTLDVEIARLDNLIPGFHQSDIVTALQNQEDFILDTLAESLGVEQPALDWHVFDNDFGNEELEVGSASAVAIIDSNESFLKFELAQTKTD